MKLKHFLLNLLFLSSIIGNTQIVFDSKIENKIDSLFLEYKGKAGAAAAIYHKDQVLYQKGFGFANLENDIKVTPQTVFETGCVAMHVTATAILLLEKEGTISLDDPINKYLTTFPKYEKGTVTIRHCLHHTSGIPDYINLLEMTELGHRIKFDNEAALDLLRKQKELMIIPGSDYRYSHSNYLILASLVEQASGMSIGKFAEQKIFTPLNMKNTFYYEDHEKVIKNRALLYGEDAGENKLKQNFDFTACGDGRLYSTVEDITKWMANFSSSKIGGDEKFMEKLFTKGILNNGNEISYALGLEYANVNGLLEIGHTGWFGGATAVILFYPEENAAIITMGNNEEHNVLWKAVEIRDLLFENNNSSATEQAAVTTSSKTKMSAKEKEKFCGAYFSHSTGYDYRVNLKDGELYVNDGEHEDLLKPIGKNKFDRVYPNSATTIEFGTEGNKKTMFLRIGERPPITFVSFQPAELTAEQLNQINGNFYSKELEVTYHLKIDDEKLQLFIGDKQIVQFFQLTADLFKSAHDGYLEFEKGTDGKISKFTINDYSLGRLSFVKQ